MIVQRSRNFVKLFTKLYNTDSNWENISLVTFVLYLFQKIWYFFLLLICKPVAIASSVTRYKYFLFLSAFYRFFAGSSLYLAALEFRFIYFKARLKIQKCTPCKPMAIESSVTKYKCCLFVPIFCEFHDFCLLLICKPVAIANCVTRYKYFLFLSAFYRLFAGSSLYLAALEFRFIYFKSRLKIQKFTPCKPMAIESSVTKYKYCLFVPIFCEFHAVYSLYLSALGFVVFNEII